MSEYNIYVLRLDQGKYYIGKSKHTKKRIQSHFDGKGTPWTRKYKPVSLVEEIVNIGPLDEDYVTKTYMLRYGIDNVRGGSYTAVVLPENEVELLKKEMNTAEDCCFNCNKKRTFCKGLQGNCLSIPHRPTANVVHLHTYLIVLLIL